jgi:hypothetical protein
MRIIKIALLSAFVVLSGLTGVSAQAELTSNNYKIVDPQVDSSGGISESSSYSLISSSDPIADARLTSGSYQIGSAFPNSIQANVPLVRCFETTTLSGDTDCTDFPNLNGAQGECGNPGCYDRAKIEVDHQNNPIDTIYLVSITDDSTATEYYLQSDHTISQTYDVGDYLTLCQLQGIDGRVGSGCQDSGGGEWDEDLQRINIFGLAPNTSYTVQVRALNGDFTESPYSPTETSTTSVPALSFDIDIADNGGSATETGGVHLIELGTLSAGSVTTATDRIWLDMGSNVTPGFNLYVEDLNNGLLGSSSTIPSESEDLASDSGNGGFGLKIDSVTEANLGPLLSAATYDTAGGDEVGAVSTTPALIFSTDTVSTNVGPLDSGRASLFVKATAAEGGLAELVTDTLTSLS